MSQKEVTPNNTKCVVCGGTLDGDFKEICRACYKRAKSPPTVSIPELKPEHLFAISAGKAIVDFLSFLCLNSIDKKRGPKDWRPGEKPSTPKTPGEARAELERLSREIREEIHGEEKPEDDLLNP